LQDFRDDGLSYAKAGFSQLSDRVFEVQEAGPIGFIQHRKRARHPQSAATRPLPARVVIDEQYIGVQLGCKSDCFALS